MFVEGRRRKSVGIGRDGAVDAAFDGSWGDFGHQVFILTPRGTSRNWGRLHRCGSHCEWFAGGC